MEQIVKLIDLVSEKINIDKEELMLLFNGIKPLYFQVCTNCKKEQPKSQFIHSRTKKNCKTCSNCRCVDLKSRLKIGTRKFILNEHYQKLKLELPPCKMCGDDNIKHKEFNHFDPKGEINPNNKKSNIVAHCMSVELMDQEAKKCECLCRKCHNKFTQSQLDSQKKSEISEDIKRMGDLRTLVNQIKISIGKCQNPKCNDVFDQTNTSFYEFDHVYRHNKTDNICSLVNRRIKIEKIKQEIDKCQLLCGYCHLEKTMDEHKENYNETVINNTISLPNKNTKLTQENVDEIRKLWIEDFNIQQKDLAEKFNVPRSHISLICNNKSWISSDYVPPKNRPKMCLTMRKISDDDILQIQKMYATGKYTYKQISDKFSCSESHTGQVCRTGKRD